MSYIFHFFHDAHDLFIFSRRNYILFSPFRSSGRRLATQSRIKIVFSTKRICILTISSKFNYLMRVVKKRNLICFSHKFKQDESSVQQLIEACISDEDKLYLCVSSPTIKDKPVQIRPWRLSDADFVLDASMPLDPRKTVFVGGVPRPLKAGNVEHFNRMWEM